MDLGGQPRVGPGESQHALLRYGFNPQDPEAWVEEPVLDAMDFNEFELEADWEALDQDIAENMAAD